METLGKITLLLILLIVGPIIGGFVFVKLWAWFFMPIFNLPALTVPQAIGVMLLINYVWYRGSGKVKEGEFWSKLSEVLLNILALAGFTLFLGWIVKHFV